MRATIILASIPLPLRAEALDYKAFCPSSNPLAGAFLIYAVVKPLPNMVDN